jgi:hypothetical protein
MSGAVEFRDECMTGGKLAVVESLKRSIAAFARADSNVKKMYIGIASGEDAVSAMKRRVDDYKLEEGINEMVALYQSSSEGNTREVEDALVEYFDSHGRCINRTGGGGGRRSAGPNYYVYLALRRWGPGGRK